MTLSAGESVLIPIIAMYADPLSGYIPRIPYPQASSAELLLQTL